MSAAAGSIRRGRPRGLWAGRIFLGFLVTSLAIGFLTLGALLAQVFLEGYKWVDAVLFFEPPSADPLISGARPAILATIYLGIIIIVLSVPLGVGTAIYLEEYANRDRWYNRMLEVNIQNLAAVPSIVYGSSAGVPRPGIGLGRVLLVGGMILTLLVLPTVIIAARAIRAVPDSIRQGAYALGSTKWQVVWRQVLRVDSGDRDRLDPRALPWARRDRAAAARRSARTSRSTRRSWATSPPSVQIYQWIARPQEEFRTLAAAGIIVLLAILLSLNAFAIWLRNKYERGGDGAPPGDPILRQNGVDRLDVAQSSREQAGHPEHAAVKMADVSVNLAEQVRELLRGSPRPSSTSTTSVSRTRGTRRSRRSRSRSTRTS